MAQILGCRRQDEIARTSTAFGTSRMHEGIFRMHTGHEALAETALHLHQQRLDTVELDDAT